MSRTAVFVIACAALLYTAHGFLPNRVLVPADIPRDLVAWKGSAATRVRVSNSLLSDVALQFIPWDAEARRQLASGRVPWRNPWAADGAPLFANPQTALLSPFTWPRLLFGLHGWALTVLLKLLVAGLGMYWLGRTLGLSDEASALSAIVFAWCGFATTLALHPHTNVFVLLPAFCAAVMSRHLLAAGLIAALLTAGGHPETLFVGVVSVVLFALVNRAPKLPWMAAFAGFLILAIQIVPFLILMWNSHARVARATELPAHFHALSLVSMLLPGILGSPLQREIDLTALVPFAENFVARSGAYIGALALVAIVVTWRRLPDPIRRGVTIGCAGLVLSLWIPGLRSVMRAIPVLNWISFDFFVIPFALFAPLAAGPALVELVRERRARLALAIVAAGFLLAIAGAVPSLAPDVLRRTAERGIAYLQARGHLHQAASVYSERLAMYLATAKWTAVRRALLPGICWIAFGAGLMWRQRTLVYGAALAELALFGYGFAPSIRVDEIAPEPAFVARIDRRFFVAGSLDAFPANLGTLMRIRQIDAYDVLTSEPETQKLERAGYDPFFHGFRTAPSLPGVRYWIDERGLTELPATTPPPNPQTGPPEGLTAGALVSLAGLLLLAILVWRA